MHLGGRRCAPTPLKHERFRLGAQFFFRGCKLFSRAYPSDSRLLRCFCVHVRVLRKLRDLRPAGRHGKTGGKPKATPKATAAKARLSCVSCLRNCQVRARPFEPASSSSATNSSTGPSEPASSSSITNSSKQTEPSQVCAYWDSWLRKMTVHLRSSLFYLQKHKGLMSII